jgi:hypothetical protein
MRAPARWSASLTGVHPSQYQPHRLHRPGRTYVETNCYADALIELLHARGDEPLAMFGFVAATDWEGDQFTYAKPPYADLKQLYGVDVHEMLPYRTLPEHIEEQLGLGQTVLVEMDAWYLPDTAATSYRREHFKTTIVPDAIDTANQRLRYFHNAGLFELDEEDYRGAFRLSDHFGEDVMDPFTEVVRFENAARLTGDPLRDHARVLLREHWARRPKRNPFAAWGERLAERDLPRLQSGDPQDYHQYAFVTVRMVGSAFELFADHIGWLLGPEASPVVVAVRQIVDGTKVMSFRLARQRPFDPEPTLSPMVQGWDSSMDRLGELVSKWS